MTPEELKAAITVTAGALNLNVASLGSATLDDHLGTLFALSGVTGRTETADGVNVTGTGSSAPFTGLAVTARFRSDGSVVTADVTGTGDENWTFLKAFSVLKNTIFETLRFQSPVLRLDPAAENLTFTGTLIITTVLAPLDLMMGGITHDVQGRIEMITKIPGLDLDITPVPDIVLYGPEGATLDLGLVTLTGLRYEIFGDPEMDYELADMTVFGRVALTGSIPFTSAGVERSVLISTDVYGWGENLLLRADLSALGNAALEEVAAFLGQSSLDVPVEINAPVALDELSIMIAPGQTPILRYVSLSIRTTEQWDIDLFVVQAIGVTFRLDIPARLSAVVTGLFAVGKSGTLEISAGLGNAVTVGGGLRAGDPPLSIREVWQDFTGDRTATHLPDLQVTHFDL